jgi:hypothetical protein
MINETILTLQNRFKPPDSIITSVLPAIFSLIPLAIEPDTFPLLLILLISIASRSDFSSAAFSLLPFPQVIQYYPRFNSDHQIRQLLQSLLQVFINFLCLRCPTGIAPFLLSSFADFSLWKIHVQTINILLQSLHFLCKFVPENHLLAIIPRGFGHLNTYSQKNTLYVFDSGVARLMQALAT